MMTDTLVLLECTLSRGAFSEDRVFELVLGNGKRYVGVAPRHYCYSRKGQLLRPEDPPPDATVPGKTTAQVIRQGDNAILVSLPDGAVVSVAPGQGGELKGTPSSGPVQQPARST
jgi:hypothetical protein